MQRLQETLSDHIIVAGFGTSGSEAVNELVARGTKPTSIVVVDCDPLALEQAEAIGCTVLQGDATRDATLAAVRAGSARCLIVSTGRDDTSILVTLTARHLMPDLPITVSVKNTDNELPARAAGATTVINPVSFAGLLMAGSAQGSGIADYMADLASHAGQVQLRERIVPAEEGVHPAGPFNRGLVLGIKRGERNINFWEKDASTLQPGDRVIEIVPKLA